MAVDKKHDDLIVAMLNFCEENWDAFKVRAEERGLDPRTIDYEMIELLSEVQE